MTISKAQILSALSGLVFVPLGAFVSAWSAKNLPGLPHFSAEEITGAATAGAGAAFGIALHYLKGLREWEKLEAEGQIKVAAGTREVVSASPVVRTQVHVDGEPVA